MRLTVLGAGVGSAEKSGVVMSIGEATREL
jgi:hypothetical protein